jgi:hypothetical protein
VVTALQRLAVARDLQKTETDATAAASISKATLLKRKVDSLRAQLLGTRAGSINDLDLFNVAESSRLVADEFKAVQALPDENERIAKTAYLKIIAGFLIRLDSDFGSKEANPVLDVLKANISSGSESFQSAMFAKFQSNGSGAVDAIKADLTAGADRLKELMVISEQAQREFYQKRSETWTAAVAGIEPLRLEWESLKKRSFLVQTTEARDAEGAAFDKYRAAREIERAKLIAVTFADPARPEKEAIESKMGDHGRALLDEIKDASPVTQEQAQAWAKSQTITASAKARLKKLGYPIEQVKVDMAEFYRLTGGRLAKITVATNGSRRANAGGIHGHNSSVINLGSQFDKRVLFHELAHHLEADPMALAAGKGFLVKRRESAETVSLRALTKNNGYESYEKAFKDSFFDPYVGKDYPDATEVFSMGIESFNDPLVLAQRIAADPEMFTLMAGFLKSQQDPLFASVKKVFAQIAQTEQAIATAKEDQLDKAIAKLSARANLVKLEVPPFPPYLSGSKGGTYVGSFKNIHVYEYAKVRDPETRRLKRGWLVVEITSVRDDGHGTTAGWLYCFESLDQAKATALVSAESGVMIPLKNPEKAMGYARAYAP